MQYPLKLPSKAEPSVARRMLLPFELFLPYSHVILDHKPTIFYACAALYFADERLDVDIQALVSVFATDE